MMEQQLADAQAKPDMTRLSSRILTHHLRQLEVMRGAAGAAGSWYALIAGSRLLAFRFMGG